MGLCGQACRAGKRAHAGPAGALVTAPAPRPPLTGGVSPGCLAPTRGRLGGAGSGGVPSDGMGGSTGRHPTHRPRAPPRDSAPAQLRRPTRTSSSEPGSGLTSCSTRCTRWPGRWRSQRWAGGAWRGGRARRCDARGRGARSVGERVGLPTRPSTSPPPRRSLWCGRRGAWSSCWWGAPPPPAWQPGRSWRRILTWHAGKRAHLCECARGCSACGRMLCACVCAREHGRAVCAPPPRPGRLPRPAHVPCSPAPHPPAPCPPTRTFRCPRCKRRR